VFDDFFVTMKHEGCLLFVLMSLGTSIKTGNPLSKQEMCQIKSERLQVSCELLCCEKCLANEAVGKGFSGFRCSSVRAVFFKNQPVSESLAPSLIMACACFSSLPSLVALHLFLFPLAPAALSRFKAVFRDPAVFLDLP